YKYMVKLLSIARNVIMIGLLNELKLSGDSFFHIRPGGKPVSCRTPYAGGSQARDTCALCAAVSRAMSKSASSGRPSGLSTRNMA
ncbi:hypothetical protein, partial [Duncaniella muris]|uniref:hypothetical protein n=1 Tax=Duncaniella muris TaxID=2094150 RepID=UPI002676CA4E